MGEKKGLFNGKNLTFWLTIISFAVLLVFAFFKIDLLTEWCKIVLSAIQPLINGLIIAYILNLSMKTYENFVFCYFNNRFQKGKVWNKLRRPICLLLTYITVFALFGLILLFIIPELTQSFTTFADNVKVNMPIYISNVLNWVEVTAEQFQIEIDVVKVQNTIIEYFNIPALLENLAHTTFNIFDSIISTTVNITSMIFTIIISLIFSAYYLADKENLLMAVKKLLYAYIPRKGANRISMFCSLSNKVFSGYVRGQLTECLILGTLCYIGMSVLGINYALLISTIVTVFAIIPMVGAFIGAGSGVLLLLLVNPKDALFFLVFFVILQQFEGNVIYPKVVGSSLGLPGFYVLAAVTIMGGLFGIGGILIGTPIAGVTYALVKTNATQRLKDNGVNTQVLQGKEVAVIYKDILEPEEKIPKQKNPGFLSTIKRKNEQISNKNKNSH